MQAIEPVLLGQIDQAIMGQGGAAQRHHRDAGDRR